MSGVHLRDRSLSSYEFYHKAIQIRNTVNKLMCSRKLPKTYRLTNAVPTCQIAREMVYEITKASKFYPNTSLNCHERRRHLALAMAACEQLKLEMQTLLDIEVPISIANMKQLVADCDFEIKLLQGAKNGVKLLGRESAESRREYLMQELEYLAVLQ